MKIKDGDFINLDYVGKVNGKIFDLTDKELAKKEKIYKDNVRYGPVTIVIGAGHLIKGLDKAVVGKEIGQEFDIEIQPEDGFGKKNPKLLKIVPESAFREQNLKPAPGMQLNIDGILGTIISTGGGRIVIDFNHPLSGKVLDYHIKLNKKVDDKKEQLLAILELYSGKDKKIFDLEIKDKSVKISYKAKEPIPDKIKEVATEDIKKYVGLEKIDFIEKGEKKE